MHLPDRAALSQVDLGRALGLSPAAVTKNKKRGMPTHSIDAAQAWRNLHVRMDMRARTGRRAAPLPLLDELAAEAAAAVEAGDFDLVEHRLRKALREAGPTDYPRFTWAVWVELTRHFVYEEFESDTLAVEGRLTADEFALIVSRVPGFGRVWLDAACDWPGEGAAR